MTFISEEKRLNQTMDFLKERSRAFFKEAEKYFEDKEYALALVDPDLIPEKRDTMIKKGHSDKKRDYFGIPLSSQLTKQMLVVVFHRH
jgi:hypothetical protein